MTAGIPVSIVVRLSTLKVSGTAKVEVLAILAEAFELAYAAGLKQGSEECVRLSRDTSRLKKANQRDKRKTVPSLSRDVSKTVEGKEAPLVSPPLPPLLFPPAPPITTPPTPPLPVSQTHARTRATRLPLDWTMPDTYREYAEGKGLRYDEIADLCETFVDWAASSPKAVKLDWSATWRGFVRRYLTERKPNASSSRNRHNVSEQAFAILDTFYDRLEQG